MKSKLFSILAILLTTVTFAQQKLIAIKGTTTDAIANTLTEAITIAQPGDKIYLPGGYFSHTPVIEKKVHIIGTGFQDGQNVTGKTTISGNLTLGVGADDSTFEGFYLTEWFIPQVSLLYIEIKRCNTLGVTPAIVGARLNNSLIVNSVFRQYAQMGDGSSVFGQNNFITNSFINELHWTQNSTITNCIIPNYIGSCDNLTIQNNIFGKTSDCNIIYGCSNISFLNNIVPQSCISSFGDSSVEIIATNTIGFSNISSLFVGATDFSFNPLFDYNLLSVVSLNATAGIFRGSNPWKVGSLPIIPNIEQNNSYLDVQAGQFKLNVKVVPQTH